MTDRIKLKLELDIDDFREISNIISQGIDFIEDSIFSDVQKKYIENIKKINEDIQDLIIKSCYNCEHEYDEWNSIYERYPTIGSKRTCVKCDHTELDIPKE